MRPILRIDTYACQTCSACQARLVCKTRAIVQYERGDLPAIDAGRCRGCMICIPACPFGAVQKTPDARQVSPSERRARTLRSLACNHFLDLISSAEVSYNKSI